MRIREFGRYEVTMPRVYWILGSNTIHGTGSLQYIGVVWRRGECPPLSISDFKSTSRNALSSDQCSSLVLARARRIECLGWSFYTAHVHPAARWRRQIQEVFLVCQQGGARKLWETLLGRSSAWTLSDQLFYIELLFYIIIWQVGITRYYLEWRRSVYLTEGEESRSVELLNQDRMNEGAMTPHVRSILTRFRGNSGSNILYVTFI